MHTLHHVMAIKHNKNLFKSINFVILCLFLDNLKNCLLQFVGRGQAQQIDAGRQCAHVQRKGRRLVCGAQHYLTVAADQFAIETHVGCGFYVQQSGCRVGVNTDICLQVVFDVGQLVDGQRIHLQHAYRRRPIAVFGVTGHCLTNAVGHLLTVAARYDYGRLSRQPCTATQTANRQKNADKCVFWRAPTGYAALFQMTEWHLKGGFLGVLYHIHLTCPGNFFSAAKLQIFFILYSVFVKKLSFILF